MKLQGLSVVFGLIVIPLVIVLTYYINLQVETIDLQIGYDTKLLDATHDAMVAFELNTANEDFSSVADSLRSIVDASSNLFLNTLATNMGLSNATKSQIEPYIPAILYTLYDGYFISSPTKTPEIGVDESGVALEIESLATDDNKLSVPGLKYNSEEYSYNSEDNTHYTLTSVPPDNFGSLLYKKKNGNYTTKINDSDIVYKTDHVLKNYMPYSARYIVNEIHSNIDVVINYTLDNYLTIIANINGVSYTKSGYLIKSDLVESAQIIDEAGNITNLFSNAYVEDVETRIVRAIDEGKNVKVKLKDEKLGSIVIQYSSATTDIEKSDMKSALIYYAKAKIFSDWIYDNLGDLQEYHIVESMSDAIIGTTREEKAQVTYSFEDRDGFIFDREANPEDENSTFFEHKYRVIRNNIQYNLNMAMSIYNERTTSSYDFNMPVISEQEWDNITSRISIVTFMQGVECGLKTYNNYSVVSSTNNELTVIPDEIYFINSSKFNDEIETYHRIDCPHLDVSLGNYLTSFVSKEVKYDKIYDKNNAKYQYDHKNLACYTCIVDGNYEKVKYKDEPLRKYFYYIALGKERNNIYKLNGFHKSEGYEIIFDVQKSVNKFSKLSRQKIKEVEITFGTIPPERNVLEPTASFKIGTTSQLYTLNTNQSKEQTIIWKNDTPNPLTFLSIEKIKELINLDDSISQTVTADEIKEAIKCIKVIYK